MDDLVFLCKIDLQIYAAETRQEIDRIKFIQGYKNADIFHIVCNLGKALKGTVVKSESCMKLIYITTNDET